MSADSIEDSGSPLPRMAKLSVREGRTLRIEWAEGERAGVVEDIDLTPAISSFKIYRPLRNNAALFSTAKLTEDGDVVAWDGPDLEMTAEMVEDIASQMMTPQSLAAFLRRNNLTQEGLAGILGYSRRQIGYYLSTGPIPRSFFFACYGYEARKRDQLVAQAKAQSSRGGSKADVHKA
jgi:hypothetical protein